MFHHLVLSVLISHTKQHSMHSRLVFHVGNSTLQFAVCRRAMVEGSEVVNYSTAMSALTNINKQHPYTNRNNAQIDPILQIYLVIHIHTRMHAHNRQDFCDMVKYCHLVVLLVCFIDVTSSPWSRDGKSSPQSFFCTYFYMILYCFLRVHLSVKIHISNSVDCGSLWIFI